MVARTYASAEQYRYGFNGKELDTEGMGGSGSTYDYGFRIYNPNIAKFLSVDPLSPKYAYYGPYQFAGNMPIWAIDIDGLECGVQSFIQQRQAEQMASSGEHDALYYRTQMAHAELGGALIAGGIYVVVYVGAAASTTAALTQVTTFFTSAAVVAQRYGNQAYYLAINYWDEGVNYLYGALCDDQMDLVPSDTPGLAKAGKATRSMLMLLKDGMLESAGGLKYGYRYYKRLGGAENALSHVFRHTVNDLTKDFHGVFDKSGFDLVEMLDIAYQTAKSQKWDLSKTTETIGNITRTLQKNGNVAYVIETGARVGFEGGKEGSGKAITKLVIATEGSTDKVVTAYPSQ